MDEVLEVKSIEELISLITDIPDGVMLEIDLGEGDADDRREDI